VDLKSGYPFWPIKEGLIRSYPSLADDLSCDVVVIGAGITGALVAYHLVEAGADVIVLDRRDVGGGSTSASTALLQYEVDVPLHQLIDQVGREHAVRSYHLCLEAIYKLENLAIALGEDVGFARKRSLYLASVADDLPELEREYAVRREVGIALDWLSQADVEARFSFSAPAALLSRDGGQVDPYRMAHALLRAASDQGARVYDRTVVTGFERDGERLLVRTDRGHTVTARTIVMAGGFEAQRYLRKRVVQFRSTYALVSEPVEAFPGWGEEQCLIWESARPYVYLRTTPDGRIIIGGEDDPSDDERRRERRLPEKTERLVERARRMFPAIPFEVAYAWGGTFGETKDGLAYIGETRELPGVYFTLGYGGNGMTYSVIAAELIRDAFLGRPNPDAQIFSFDR
jgi:glycine/D-amino acid oxidase-like deaminating enzyme